MIRYLSKLEKPGSVKKIIRGGNSIRINGLNED
jgi:hypothetical protein